MPRTMSRSTIDWWISGSSTGRRASRTSASAGHWVDSRRISTTGVGRIPVMTAADLTPDEFAAAVAAVTTAFGDPTRREIYLFVRDPSRRRRNGGGGRRAVRAPPERRPPPPREARRPAATSTSSSSGTNRPGRPSKRYRTSADDTHLAFPPRRDDLLGTLLARALERLPVDEARTSSPKKSATSTGARSRRAWSRPKATAR